MDGNERTWFAPGIAFLCGSGLSLRSQRGKRHPQARLEPAANVSDESDRGKFLRTKSAPD
ncbi:hypothetical protein SBBP1_210003 [Burkholderiales bacterium]|nr:hypothetical protein SBBP1_210003 [Burkholderiales bacterium]